MVAVITKLQCIGKALPTPGRREAHSNWHLAVMVVMVAVFMVAGG